MKRIRKMCRLFCCCLLLGVIILLAGGPAALASHESYNGGLTSEPNQEEPVLEEQLELKSPYPVLKEKSGRLFEFQVEMHYTGNKSRVFDLSVLGAEGAYVDILASFTATDKGIESILLKPNEEFPEIIKVRYNPAMKGLLDPGRYVITLQASSGDIRDTIELTAVVTARYDLFINTPTGRLNAEVTAGQDNHIGVRVRNNSSVALDEVRFSANVPQGWGVSFTPEEVNPLEAGRIQDSDMVITPHKNTIAGDYEIAVMAISSEALAEVKLRITVATPTIWGWVGVLIVIAVIAGIAVIFVLLGRR
jgi:uncharacterized membrane protein